MLQNLKSESLPTWSIVYILGVLGLLAYRDLVGYNLGAYAYMVALSIPMLFLNIIKLKVYVLFTMPLMIGVTPYYLGVAYLLLIFKGKTTLRQLAPAMIILILETILSAVYITDVHYQEYLVYYSAIGLFFYYIFDESTADIDTSLRWYTYGLSFALLMMLIRILSGGIMEVLDNRSSFSETENMMEYFHDNANNIGLFSITVLSTLMLGRKKLHMPMLTYYPILVIAITAGIFSVSRTWIISLGIIIILYALALKNKYSIVFIIGTIFAILLFLNTGIGKLSTSFYVDRFTDGTASSGGERTELFSAYLNAVLQKTSYVFFGVGALNAKYAFNIFDSIHNGPMQIFISYGIIGIIIFALSAVNVIKSYSSFHVPLLFHIPFLTIFIFLQTDQFLVPAQLMFPIIVGVLAIKLYQYEKSVSENI